MIPRRRTISGQQGFWRAVCAALCLSAIGFQISGIASAQSTAIKAYLSAAETGVLLLAMQDDQDEEEFGASDRQLNDAHNAYLQKSDLQLERPEQPPEEIEVREPRKTPGWIKWIAELLDTIGEFLSPLLKIMFWLVVAGVIGAMLYFIFSEMARLRFDKDGSDKSKTGDDVIVDVRPDEATARTLLEEADQLAKEGKFAEAVHLLLFRSIEDIQARLEGGVPRSLTAREIGGLGMVPERARTALSPIIRIVERSFFGGRDVDQGAWTEARASYESFAFGKGWA